MCALESSGSWEFVPLPIGKSIAQCQWLYTLKTRHDSNIDYYKTQPVAKAGRKSKAKIIVTLSYCQNDIYLIFLFHCNYSTLDYVSN